MKKFYQPYQLSALQRAFLIPYHSVSSILDPTRGDQVAGLGDATSHLAIKKLHSRFLQTKSGQDLIKFKPLITEETLHVNKLRQLPLNTLGRRYVDYMDEHHFSADERSIVHYHTNPDHAYVICRYRQVHDFWHALSGFPPTILGELVLKAFEYEVTGLPVCAISATFGQLRLNLSELNAYYRVGLPWAMRAGRKCAESHKHNSSFDLLTYKYEENLEKDIDEVRKELSFEVAPKI